MQRYQDSVLQAPLSTPIVGASVQVNIFGGGAATIYSDNGVTVEANPTLTDANGRFSFYAADGRYTLVISKSGFTTQTITDILLADPAQESADTLLFIQSGISAVARTVQSKERDIVSVKDFGAVGDGVTDDTAALQSWANIGGILFLAAGTFKITSAITFPSNTLVIGAGQGVSTIICSNGDINQFTAVSKTKVVFQDFTISVSVAGTSGSLGGIHLQTCSYCVIERVEVTGVSWAGVLLNASSYCTVKDCYFNSFRGTVTDSGDVAVYGNASFNIVVNNKCYGGNQHGILIQDPAGATLPLKNIVSGNRIGQHTTYGIANYMNTAADVFTQILDNYIEDIQGSTLGNTSGAGIYVVGAGGVIVEGNTIKNCCVQTTTLTLAPAGIGVNGNDATLATIDIVGNSVEGMTKFYGIYLTSCSGGANIIGNRLRTPSANTGAFGTIGVTNSSNVNIGNNHLTISNSATSQPGIYIYANGANLSNVNVTGNIINGGDYGSIVTANNGAFNVIGLVVSGNIAIGGTSANIPLRIVNVTQGIITGNSFNGSSNVATVNQAGSTNVRYSGNVSKTSGTVGLLFTGTNTGSYWDKSNFYDGTVTNSGTGLIVEFLGNAVPVTGTWAVGDRVEQSVPVVASPKGWRCTVAGTQGTWVSEGNL